MNHHEFEAEFTLRLQFRMVNAIHRELIAEEAFIFVQQNNNFNVDAFNK